MSKNRNIADLGDFDENSAGGGGFTYMEASKIL